MRDKHYDNLQKMNWMFFIMIVLLIILLFFASTIKYLVVQYGHEKSNGEAINTLQIELNENTVQEVYGALRPIVVVEAIVTHPSVIDFEMISDKHNDSFKTPGYVISFERTFFIPPEAHSTDFVVKVTAKDKEGNIIEKEIELQTKKVMKPKFNIS